MESEPILTTAIEVAIAIAGFSAVVVAIAPRRRSEWPEPARLSISALLLASIATVFFGFLPLLIFSAHVPESRAWPLASSAHVAYLAAMAAYRLRQLVRLPPDDSPQRRLILISSTVVFVAVASLQLTNAIWLQAPWPYLTSIVLMVVASFGIFASLLWQLWSTA